MEPSLLTGIPFPAIDPVAFAIGPVAIRWYALAYVAGILLGWVYLGRLNAKNHRVFSPKAYDDFITWAVLGIILGGRIGYCLFYQLPYYLQHPIEVFMVWKGGMSFHGGLIGAILGMYMMSRRFRLDFLKAMDLCACITPIGLFFGRIANFINAELVGRQTDVNWGVVFPGEVIARHPSQLYQAALEGLLLFTILNIMAWRTHLLQKRGAMGGLFLLLYALFRSIGECFREPDVQLGFILPNVTMGQILCIPMALLGIFLILRAKKKAHATHVH